MRRPRGSPAPIDDKLHVMRRNGVGGSMSESVGSSRRPATTRGARPPVYTDNDSYRDRHRRRARTLGRLAAELRELTDSRGVDVVLDPLRLAVRRSPARTRPRGSTRRGGFAVGTIPQPPVDRPLLHNVSAVGVTGGAILVVGHDLLTTQAAKLDAVGRQRRRSSPHRAQRMSSRSHSRPSRNSPRVGLTSRASASRL